MLGRSAGLISPFLHAMQPLTHPLTGTLYQRGTEVALLLDETASTIFLRYALITQGVEEHIFPAFLLDDWGNEKKGGSLYQWIYEEGQRFPRAEIFGFEQTGEETQCFLRELEIYFKLPTYAYPAVDSPVTAGVLLDYVLLPTDEPLETLERTSPPAELSWALRRARVDWWRVNPRKLPELGFAIYRF